MRRERSLPRMQIVTGSAQDIARLEPLWLAMLAHHQECRPPASEEIAFRDPPETWRRRRARYEAWIEEPTTRLLIAQDDAGEAIGYAMLTIRGGESTLQTGDRVGELESLSVAPSARGAGVGSGLMEAAFDHFRSQGVRDMTLSVMVGNDDAQRFYERHGQRPYFVAMIGRIPDPRDAAERT